MAFESYATNLVPNDTNGDRDVFVRDNLTGAVERVFESKSLVDLSEDGRYVAARGNEYCPGPFLRPTLLIHDRQTGTTECVNEAGFALDICALCHRPVRRLSEPKRCLGVRSQHRADPTDTAAQRARRRARQVDMSDDGRHVVFGTWEHDTGICTFHPPAPPVPCPPRPGDVFVHDRQTGTTTQVPLPSDAFAGYPSISGDGRWIAYHLAVEEGTPPDIFLTSSTWIYDRQTGVTEPVSVDPEGTVADTYDLLRSPPISDDGRFVAFVSSDPLDPENPSRFNWGLYVRDMVEGRTTLINTNAGGKPATSQLFDLEIADDGRYVAFTSLDSGIVSGDTNGASDVFLRAIPLPRIESVTPSSVARGTSATITILGEGFAPQPTVQVLGAGAAVTAVTRVSEHELSVDITVDQPAPTGPRTIVVSNTGTGPGPAAADSTRCGSCLTVT